LQLIPLQTTLDPRTSKKIFELALDQQEESEEDDFGLLDVTASDKKTPRQTKPISEDEDDDDEGLVPFDEEDIDLDAELELVRARKFVNPLTPPDLE